MRLPRMTIFRWMIVILGVGLATAGIVGGTRLKRRREHFRSLAQRYSALETMCLEYTTLADAEVRQSTKEVELFEKYLKPSEQSLLGQTQRHLRGAHDTQESWALKTAHCTRLKQKYEYVARYPWLPVDPDPPEPD